MRLSVLCLGLLVLWGCSSNDNTSDSSSQTGGSGGKNSSTSGSGGKGGTSSSSTQKSNSGSGGATGSGGAGSSSTSTGSKGSGGASASSSGGSGGATSKGSSSTGGTGGRSSGSGGASSGTGGVSSGSGGASSGTGGVSSGSGGASSGTGGASLGTGGASSGSGGSSGAVTGGVPDSVISAATKATDLVAAWKLGWNLGNSLDADGCGASGAETCWGNPKSTQAMLTYVASLGFNVVRIPVTWSEHLGSGPSYTIDSTWMSRVDEVVNYAIKAGLSAIINVHHDGADGVSGIQWIKIVDSSGNVTDSNTSAVVSEFTAVWTQIATHFKDYDNRLVFEGMNEVHNGYSTPTSSWYDVINKLNQTFVTTVRGVGSKNADRFLVVPGYNTNIDQTVEGFKAPTDTVFNHLILSYHYYDPYQFTLSNATHTWGAAYSTSDTWGQEDYLKTEFDKMKTNYVDKGLPVIMGEYGASYQSETAEPYRRYWTEYATKAAHDRGIAPILWDAGQELVDRTNLSVRYSDVYQAMVRATTSSYAISDIAAPK